MTDVLVSAVLLLVVLVQPMVPQAEDEDGKKVEEGEPEKFDKDGGERNCYALVALIT
jgi:hypothetical protein